MSDSESRKPAPGPLVSAVIRPTTRPPSGESFFIEKDRAAMLAEKKTESTKVMKDLEDCRFILTKLVIALSNREVLPERVMIEPSILLLPFPYINNQGDLELQVNSMDLDDTTAAYEKVFDEIRRLPYFPTIIQKELDPVISRTLGLESRVNLVKALTVFLEDLMINNSKLEIDHEIDFLEAADLIATADFVPPRRPLRVKKFDTYQVNREQITVDLRRLLKFRIDLTAFFHQKRREKLGLGRKNDSMKLFAVNGSAQMRTAERSIKTPQSRVNEQIEETLRDYLSKIGK